MRERTFKNSPKGRSEIPEKQGDYILLDAHGNDISNIGWNHANNLRTRIKEHYYDKSKDFKFIKVRTGKR
ncbi:MAG TPA: hypothetical protein VMZ91_00660 [Candidatus Paceibacterota bacterium]|nr:hypothetical protein [Candidatus Paceibacterota bacterium]